MNTQILIGGFNNKQSVSQTPYISYQNLSQSAFIIPLMMKGYFPIYNISGNDIVDYYPLLIFIESLVYQTDTEVKANQFNGTSLSQFSPWNSRKKIIQSLLKELNLEHPTILNQLEKLREFFELKSQLVTSEKITYEDVILASELRSSDTNIPHCTLIQMSGKLYRPEVFDIMSPINILLEFHDDFRSYKEDVAAGNYNTYWMFEKLYGEEAHHYLKAEIDRYRNLFEEKLKQFLEDEQEVHSVK